VLAPRAYIAGGVTSKAAPAVVDLLNPGVTPAHVRLTFDFTDGRTVAATLTLAPKAARRLPVAALAHRQGGFGLVIAADRPVTAMLSRLRNGHDRGALVGATAPARMWYLAGSGAGRSAHDTIALLNPDPRQSARVTLRLLPGRGAPRVAPVSVSAHAETVVDLNRLLPGQAVSVVAMANRPVVVARSRTSGANEDDTTAAVGATAASRTWIFAEGNTANRFQTYLTVFDPGQTMAHVRTLIYGRGGRLLANKILPVAGGHDATVSLNTLAPAISGMALVVTADVPVVVERDEYMGAPSTASVPRTTVLGVTAPGERWSFAEGDTRGRGKFMLLFNPGARPVTVRLMAYGGDGRTASAQETLKPRQRGTYNMGQLFHGLAAVRGETVQTTAGHGVVAERAIFSSDSGILENVPGQS